MLVGASAAGLRAEPPADAIRGVIGAQFDAFRAQDEATAFTFASPAIKGMFQTPQNFGVMVRNGYPMIWAPGDVEFLGLREERGFLYQRVRVTDRAGEVFFFDYEMVESEAGWQINGVFPVKSTDFGV
ncbi:DUF4864 domain-containing protein [Ostreiculturibacter nitratireducens]|uniref:DUF4864 domain-containing protein n=1 Tax=Ostreiculturibacter nitratireducens TaxID=3075226 RepID=UPI0031B58599